LVFEGIRGSSYTGDAAIDNVELRECGGGGKKIARFAYEKHHKSGGQQNLNSELIGKLRCVSKQSFDG